MYRVLHNIHLSQALAKAYLQYGITNNEYIVLNAYCFHEGFYQPGIDWSELSEMTGISVVDLKQVFLSLADRKKIVFDGDSIDKQELYQALSRVLEANKSIGQRISESIRMSNDIGYNNKKHLGYVVLLPFQVGIAVTQQQDEWWKSSSAQMWTKKDMLSLSDEIRSFAEEIDDDFIRKYNHELIDRQELHLQMEQEKREQKRKLKIQRTVPKPGFVVLYRNTNNCYYFTYTTSLSLEQKIANIKSKSDAIAIIHTFETSHTHYFIDRFIKKQFSNRLKKDNPNYYALTDEDVAFIKEKNSHLMQWSG